MATTAKATKKNITIVVDGEHPEFQIALNEKWEQNSEFYAHKLNQESEALMAPYVLDSYPKSKAGKFFTPDEGAYAIYKACMRLFGSAPIPLPSGNSYPENRAVQMQRFQYTDLAGNPVYEMDLDNPNIWNTQTLVRYIKANMPDYDLPEVIIGDELREKFLTDVKATMTIVGTRTETVQIGWKLLQYPNNDNIQIFALQEAGSDHGVRGEVFRLAVKARRRDRNQVDEFFNAVVHELENANLFKGRCFEVGPNGIVYRDPFGGMDPSNLVFSQRVQTNLDRQVFSVLKEHEKARRRNKALLGTKVLLSGGPGVGKSEAMKWAAQVALQNGWTAAFLKPGATDETRDHYHDVVSTVGRRVLFKEDIEADEVEDETLTTKQKMEARSRRLAIRDGISNKDGEEMEISSTNHIEMIQSASMRPGRIDVVIAIESPDCDAFIKLTTQQCGNLLPSDVDLRALWGPEEPKEESTKFVKRLRELDASFLSNGLIETVQRFALQYEDGERVTQEDMYWILDAVVEHHAIYKARETAERAFKKDSLSESVIEVVRTAVGSTPELLELAVR